MKIAHWTMYNRSGMNRVAESMVQAERTLGLDSIQKEPVPDISETAQAMLKIYERIAA